MTSKSKGLCLAIGSIAAIVGYMIWQFAVVGMDTKYDDVVANLNAAAAGSGTMPMLVILIGVGLIINAAGLNGIRGLVGGSKETIGIFCVTAAIILFVVSLGGVVAMGEVGNKFVTANAGAVAASAQAAAAAGAGDAAAAAAAGAAAAAAADIATALASAGGFTLAANTAIGQLGGLLFSLGFLFIGLAYKESKFTGALSFIPMGWLAILAGTVGLVSTLIIGNINVDTSSQVTGIAFLLSTIWTVLVGVKLIRSEE
jgi:hypothetical protein